MPAKRVDVTQIMRHADVVAAVLAPGEIFGWFKRSFDLPPFWTALVTTKHGAQRVSSAGGEIDSRDVEEVTLFRTHPIVIHFDFDELTSSDDHLCRAWCDLQLQVHTEPSEAVAFRRDFLANKTIVQLSDLRSRFASAVHRGVKNFLKTQPVTGLLNNLDNEAFGASIRAAVQPLLFQCGMGLGAVCAAGVDSRSYRQSEQQRLLLERRSRQTQKQHELQQALRRAQNEHMAHLEELLIRLKTTSERTPGADLRELLKTFDQRQRGELYGALWSNESAERPTEWVAVASGHEILYYAPDSPGHPTRQFSVETPAGALRSLSFWQTADRQPVLLVGAARGVLAVCCESGKTVNTYLAPEDTPGHIRGGFNAASLAGDHLFGTHSELGLLRWRADGSGPAQALLAEQIRKASTVRLVQFADGKVHFSADAEVLSFPVSGQDKDASLPDRLIVYTGSNAPISSLLCTGSDIWAGNTAGEILRWTAGVPENPKIVYRGSNRAVESIALLSLGGSERLFFADTSTRVNAQIIGEVFSCGYSAGGQTIRRAEVAPDWIAATNEHRDRLLIWPTHKPDAVPSISMVSKHSNHSVQDVALIPRL